MTRITSTLCLLTCVVRMLFVLTYHTISVADTLLIVPLTEGKTEAAKEWVTLPGSGRSFHSESLPPEPLSLLLKTSD